MTSFMLNEIAQCVTMLQTYRLSPRCLFDDKKIDNQPLCNIFFQLAREKLIEVF